MKKIAIISIALVIMSACVREIDKEVIKTVIVTPSGLLMPDSLAWFFSNPENVSNYKGSLNDFKSLHLVTNEVSDYVIVTYGRDKCARNLPDTTLLPCNCITFSCFRNNEIFDFYHYRIKDWKRDLVNEDIGYLTNNSTPIWNYRYFSTEYVYEIVPGNGATTYRKSVLMKIPF